MPKTDYNRKQRRKEIVEYLEKTPYTTDEELAEHFKVSISTIRLDRSKLGIKELRERLKEKAIESMKFVTAISENEFIGDMLEYEPKKRAMSMLKTTKDMTFTGINVVKGSVIYSFAESIAMSLIPTKAALVGVANIKYVNKVYENESIYAYAEVKRKTETGYIVWVKIINKDNIQVFRGKFILKGIG